MILWFGRFQGASSLGMVTVADIADSVMHNKRSAAQCCRAALAVLQLRAKFLALVCVRVCVYACMHGHMCVCVCVCVCVRVCHSMFARCMVAMRCMSNDVVLRAP